MDLNTL